MARTHAAPCSTQRVRFFLVADEGSCIIPPVQALPASGKERRSHQPFQPAMRKPIVLIGAFCLALVAIDVAHIAWNDDPPTQAFTTLTVQPPRLVIHPKSNGYLLLLGFAAASTADPVQMGHEMWLESESHRGYRFFDYDKDLRAQLQVAPDIEIVQQAWSDPDPVAQFRKSSEPLGHLLAEYPILMDRYRQWLTMPFDEWGYGHPGCPRFTDFFVIHRLYVADGVARSGPAGIERLEKDLTAWRTVMARARTLPTKMMAVSAVDDDLSLLSAWLGRADLDTSLLSRLAELARPLDQDERSLHWPIQNEFTLGVSRYAKHPTGGISVVQMESDNNRKWVATLADLSPGAFQKAELSLPTSLVARSTLKQQQSLNVYAAYFEGVITAADTLNGPFPTLQTFASGPTSLLDYLTPFRNMFLSGSDFAWEPFRGRLIETDARLRLITLQARLRSPSSAQTIPARIAEVGAAYYDPFTGLPMLWSQARGRIYSVGRDGKDDGGDTKLDVSVQVPAILGGSLPHSGHPLL